MLHFSRVFPSGSCTDRSSWLDAADNSKLLALRNEWGGRGWGWDWGCLSWRPLTERNVSDTLHHCPTADLVSAGPQTWDDLAQGFNPQFLGQSHTVSEQEEREEDSEGQMKRLGDIHSKLNRERERERQTSPKRLRNNSFMVWTST